MEEPNHGTLAPFIIRYRLDEGRGFSKDSKLTKIKLNS
jgi:hypothetical protein